jgi:hypothetical protein
VLTPIRTRLEAIKRLCRTFERKPLPSWNYRATFGTNHVYPLRRGQLRVAFNVHVVPPGHDDGVLTSSVTVWPPDRKRRGSNRAWNASSKRSGGWNEALRESNWYGECEKLLRSYGYHGKWRPSPSGRFGDFWRKHRDSKALAAELAVLQRLSAEQFWRAPSNKRMQELARSVRCKGGSHRPCS